MAPVAPPPPAVMVQGNLMGLGQPHSSAFWPLVLVSPVVESGFFLLVHVAVDPCSITELRPQESDGSQSTLSPRFPLKAG